MPEVEVDAELASKAAEVAAARGESLEEVIARALQRYVISSLDE
jgi:predicted HicB family RNase H-like nuclease